MAIDYNQDIAPLRQQYFPMLAGEKGFDQSMKYRQDVLMPMRMQTMKIEQHAMSMKRQEIAFESQKLGLQKARKDAQRQNEALEYAPKIDSLVNGILDDDTLSPLEQQEELNRSLVDYSSVIAYSPVLASKVTAAEKAIGAQQSIEDQKKKDALEAKQDKLREESRYLEAMKIALGNGDVDLANKLTEMPEGYGGVGITPLEEAIRSGAASKKKELTNSILAAQQKAEDDFRKENMSKYQGLFDQVSKIEAKESEYDPDNENPEYALGEGDKDTLYSIYTELDPVKYPAGQAPTILQDVTDRQLRSALLGSLATKINEFSLKKESKLSKAFTAPKTED